MDDTVPHHPVSAEAIRRARLALCTDFFVFGAGIGMWAVNIPIIAARLRIDTGQVGFALLAMASGAIIAMPLGGLLVARLDSRRPATIAGVAYALAIAFLLLVPDQRLLFVAAGLFGLLMGFYEVAMNAQGTEIEAASGRPGMSMFHAFFSLGGLAGAGAGALAIRAGLAGGAGEVAAALALAILVGIAGVFLLPRWNPASGSPTFILPNRAVLAFGLLAALAFALEGAFIDWGALFLTGERAASHIGGATGVGTFMAATAIFRLVGDHVVERFGRRRTLIGSGGLVVIGTAVAVLPSSLSAIVLGFGLVGAGAANIVPILFSASARVPGIPPALGIASATTLAYCGFLIAPPLLGFIGREVGLAVALGLAGCAGLIVAAAGTRIRL